MKGKKVLAAILAASVIITNGSISLAAEPADNQEQNISTEAAPDVPTVGTSEGELTEGDFSYTVSNGQATITKYNGTSTVVEIPETVEGTVPVTALADDLFLDNTQVEEVTISKNIASMGKNLENIFCGASSLHDIYVDDDNRTFYDTDGVLFFYGASSGLPILMKYPEAKEGSSYVVSGDTYKIWLYAFNECTYLKRIVIPSSVSNITIAGFSDLTDTTIILQQTDPSQINLVDRAFASLTNCTLIVKNEAMKNAVESQKDGATPIYNPVNTTVKIASDPDLDDSYRTPATSLVFSDTGTTSRNITIKPGETQPVSYAIAPADTTDSVTWESSSPEVAAVTVKNGKVTVEGIKDGKCAITGRDESNHAVTLNITVFTPIKTVDLDFAEYINPSTSVVVELQKDNSAPYVPNPDGSFTKGDWVYLDVTADYISGHSYYATYEDNVTWSSSAPQIVSVDADSDNPQYGNLTYHGLGSATITGSIAEPDSGKTFEKSVTLNVKKNIDYCDIVSVSDVTYTGKKVKPTVVIKNGSTTLKEGVDYTVSCDFTGPEEDAYATIHGIGNYTGETDTPYFSIKKPVQKSQKITGIESSYKKAYKSSFTLQPKAKTACSYNSANEKIATVDSNGKVSIKGTGETTITITAKETSTYKKATKKVTIYAVPANQKITGVESSYQKAYNSSFTLQPKAKTACSYNSANEKIATVDSKGKVIIKGTGDVAITITAKKTSNYNKATKKVTIHAVAANQKITGVESSYKKAYKGSFTLKPKAKTTCSYNSSNTKIATVSSKGKVTIKGTGKATITVTAKKTSKYNKASKKVTIYAVPAKMKTPTVKAGKKSLTVAWSKDSRADGYQIQYSTNSKFKDAQKVSCSQKAAKATIKKLKTGKTYYVRIRAYKKIGDKNYYGSCSSVKSVKVK